MLRGVGFRKAICFLIIILLVSCLIVLRPINPQRAHGNFIIAATIFGVAVGVLSVVTSIIETISPDDTPKKLGEIQRKLDEQNVKLDNIIANLNIIQKTLDTLTRNLEINTKEILTYIKNIGAQDGIDSIKTRFAELEGFARANVKEMTPQQRENLKEETGVWATNVLGTWDIKKAVTKISSAICPDIPGQEGVLELWTDQAILNMPAPKSPANDFALKVESTTPSGASGGGDSTLPIIAERPIYFDYQEMQGGDVEMGAVKPAITWYFSEGSCRPEFDPFICVNNLGDSVSEIEITYMLGDAQVVEQNLEIPAHSRTTVVVKDLLGVADDAAHDFSCKVESTNGVPTVAERVQYFDYHDEWSGGHVVRGVTSLGPVAYIAEGTCRPGFETYITIQNPGEVDTAARLTYMLGDGTTGEQAISVPAHSRETVRPADILGVADDPAHDFSTMVESTGGVDLVVERPMYFNYDGVWPGGHCSTATYSPGDTSYFAEGTIRGGFDSYICIQNPNDEPVEIKLTYMWGDGTVTTDNMTIPASSRETVNVKDSPAAKTLTNYYRSLENYFNVLLYYQSEGLIEVCEAYNQKYMGRDANEPSQQALNYLRGNYKDMIQKEFDEFLSCVESLVASWSSMYTPNGLVPEAASIFSMADSFYMNVNNALLYQGDENEETFYGAFGRAFAQQSEMQQDSAPEIVMTGPGVDALNESEDRKVWRKVKLKHYDQPQGRLVTDDNSVCVVRYQQNCQPGDGYTAGFRQGWINTGGTSPTLHNIQTFHVQREQGAEPFLPFGSFTSLRRSQAGLLGHFGPTRMPADLRSSPVLASAISAGHDFCIYLQEGSISGWGDNSLGRLNFPPGSDNLDIATGYSHGLALKKDGSIVGWGDNAQGQINCPAGNDYVQIAAGRDFSLALEKDGSIVGWGFNKYGQTDCPTGNDYVQADGGSWHGIALKKDGSIVGWG